VEPETVPDDTLVSVIAVASAIRELKPLPKPLFLFDLLLIKFTQILY
jgi:hypothetical protein